MQSSKINSFHWFASFTTLSRNESPAHAVFRDAFVMCDRRAVLSVRCHEGLESDANTIYWYRQMIQYELAESITETEQLVRSML